MTKAQRHQVIVKVDNRWETPPELLADKTIQYNIHPKLDVCATAQNTKFEKYFTPEDNALNKEWDEDFFMNPPYSQINQWMQKATTQQKKHNVNALILVFAKTGVRWWHEYVEEKAEIHFQRGRIRFLLNGVEPRYCVSCKIRWNKVITHCESCHRTIGKSSPTYDSAWIIFRKEVK